MNTSSACEFPERIGDFEHLDCTRNNLLIEIYGKEERTMACMTLFEPMAMATTQLARVIQYEDTFALPEGNLERNSLRMSWVVVTGGDGRQKLQIQWTPSADLR